MLKSSAAHRPSPRYIRNALMLNDALIRSLKAADKPKKFTGGGGNFVGLILLLPLMLFIAGCAVQSTVDAGNTLNEAHQAAEVRRMLRHGDWLVSRGVHKPDNLVASLTNMPLSHAAIFDAENEEVIEADSTGVHPTPLAAFLAGSQRVLVIRPIWSSPENSAAAVARARGWIGRGYNYTGLIGLNIVPNRYYCTQVAIFAYRPFIKEKPENPIPRIIKPGQMYHWGRIIYDSGPISARALPHSWQAPLVGDPESLDD